MRQSLKTFASFAAALTGLALFLAASTNAAETVTWKPTTSGTWDTTSANWTASGSDAHFANGDAVVFGLDASGNPIDTKARIDISGTGFNIAASGTNPGMIIASGSWFFIGGQITGGSILVTGSSAVQLATAIYEMDTAYGGSTINIRDQRIDVVDNVDFKYSTTNKHILNFTGSAAKTVNGGAISTGDNANLTLEGTYGGIFFSTQTTSQAGGAIYTGGNLVVNQVTSGSFNWFNFDLKNNSATLQGGAIYSKGDITMSSSSGTASLLTPNFDSNKSGAEGGAIYTEGNISIVASSTFTSNSAAGKGGAIYATGTTTIGRTAVFSSNTSTAAGGAIYTEKDFIVVTDSGTLAPSIAFGANKADGDGGAIYATGSTVLLGVSTFSSNTSAGKGGAIYAKGDVNLTGTLAFSHNTSGTAGGSIYTESNLIVSGSGSTVTVGPSRAAGSDNHISSIAYVAGTMSLGENTTFNTVGGGISAQEFDFDGATISFAESGTTSGVLNLTTIDASGNAVGAAGKINFNNTTINAYLGDLTTTPGSDINISGTFTVNATGKRVDGTGSVISANIVGTGQLVKTGTQVLELTGANTYTGTTTVAQGTLIGNITDNSALNILAGGIYKSGAGTDRNIATLNGAGLIDMMGNTLNATAGDYTSGTIINTAVLNKIGATALTVGNGTVATINVNEGTLNMGGDKHLTVTGTTTVVAGSTLGVNISDTLSLTTHTLNTQAGSTINIAGYGNISEYSTTGTHILIQTTDAIVPGSYSFMLHGTLLGTPPTDDSEFLSFTDISSGTQIAVLSSLVWNNTAPATAHGSFNVNSGTFVLNTALAPNTTTTAYSNGWDGNSLTKKGDGTLVLTGVNTYTGTTTVENGLLINQGVIGTGNVVIGATGTAINTGTINGNIYNAGDFTFQSSSSLYPSATTSTTTTISTTTTVSGSTVVSDSTTITTDTTFSSTYWNGKLVGNIENTGTFTINLNEGYTWSGTLSGDTGIIIKTGTATITLDGPSTYSGTVQIDQGSYVSGKAHNFDSADTYIITSTAATLNLGGYDQNLKNVINQGILSFGPAATATTTTFAKVTIANYTSGTDTTGIIAIRSNYNAGLADHLTITGTATGTHTIRITNTDNITPDKTRPYIKIVEGPNVTVTNTDFVISGTLDVGMGRLIVARGDGTSFSDDTNAWYLASGNQLSNVADAILSTASVTGLEWHYQLDTVRQRMGDLRQEALMAPPEKRQSPLAYTTVTSKGGNAWLRVNAYRLDADPQITSDAFSENVGGIAFGYDKTYRWEDNQYLLGANAVISTVSRDFDTRGDGKTNNYGIGFYFSYLKDNGWYGDTTLLITKNNNSFNTHPIDRPTELITGDYGNVSWGISQEIGKVIKHKKTGWWVEPSVQAEFVVIGGKTYTTNTGITDSDDAAVNMEVKMADANIAQFRAALRVGRDIPGSRFKPYVRAAIATVKTWGGRIRAGAPEYPQYYTADMDGRRLEAGAGLSYVVDEKSQLYLDYEYAKANDYKRPWAINVGYRCTW